MYVCIVDVEDVEGRLSESNASHNAFFAFQQFIDFVSDIYDHPTDNSTRNTTMVEEGRNETDLRRLLEIFKRYTEEGKEG